MKKCFFVFCLSLFAVSFAKEVTVSVGAGKNWKQKMNPQFSVWLEDSEGNFVRTLYVTSRAAKKNWIFGPKEGRPESLPVWYGSAGKSEGIDVVTGATPKGGVVFKTVLEDDREYFIKAEFNNSFDYNDTFTKKNSGVNGQPSVVYGAELTSDFKGEVKLEFLGTGSVNAGDGNIHKAEGLTTAKDIVQCITVVCE